MKSLKLFKKYFLSRQPANGPIKQDDFAMHLEPVDPDKYKKALFNTGFHPEVLTTIDYRGRLYEVFQVAVPGHNARTRLLIFAGVHGNEFAAALAVIDLVKHIEQNPEQYAHLDIRIVTPLNPVGFVHQSRYNEIGRDINRDFKEFSTSGGRLQKEVIDQFKPDVIISLHEGPQDGFFVIAEGNTPKTWRKHITTALNSEQIPLAQKSFFGVKIGEGFWQKQPLVYTLQKMLGIYTLGRYAYDHGIIALTTESPWTSQDIATRKKSHIVLIRTVAKLI